MDIVEGCRSASAAAGTAARLTATAPRDWGTARVGPPLLIKDTNREGAFGSLCP